jgi:D-alanyl-D-alanine carboxypeptidase/D-alanyl-D-alanine-endopeptidase (penicillin-binding protein 4)
LNYNVVALDANTFLTQGFAAAWELAGGTWARTPVGKNGNVPLAARLLLQFEGINLGDAVLDINKYSNNVMARQLLLTLALEKMGKPATIANGDLVIQSWLKQNSLDFPGLVIENGSGLSRTEAITAEQMNQLLLTARNLSVGDVFYNSLPIAGTDGTMKNRLMTQLRKFLHMKKKPEVRIKTGSLADVRTISGYVMSKSGKLYAVTSFINHPNASKGLEAHDQLLAWLMEDGPEPKHAR